MNTKYCGICKKKNKTLHWHISQDSGDIWVWCCACGRAYSLHQYCHLIGIPLKEFLKNDFDFSESAPNEVKAQEWPRRFLPLSDPRSQPGVDYIRSRGLDLDGGMYYDIEREGIVFPYYFGSFFCGAQTRFIVPKEYPDGSTNKIDTLPGTRLGLLFGLWNQDPFVTNVRAVGVCEGYLNALSLQQATNKQYGGVQYNPWKFVCVSGAGGTDHHKEVLKGLNERGIKVISALDTDEAGKKGLQKFIDAGVITHFALTDSPDKDWNDVLREEGHAALATKFIRSINKVSYVHTEQDSRTDTEKSPKEKGTI